MHHAYPARPDDHVGSAFDGWMSSPDRGPDETAHGIAAPPDLRFDREASLFGILDHCPRRRFRL
jgi:hypothetical protein